MEKPHLDREVLLERLGGDEAFLSEMASTFISEQELSSANIRNAITSTDHASLEEHAHRLKSSLYAFGLNGLAQSALALENCGRERGSMAEAEEVLVDLLCGLQLVLPDFRKLAEPVRG